MQLEVKTVLNRIQHFVGFVYQDVRLCSSKGKLRIEGRDYVMREGDVCNFRVST